MCPPTWSRPKSFRLGGAVLRYSPLRPMREFSSRWIILAFLLALGLSLVLSLRRTEADRARSTIESVARALEFESRAELVSPRRLRAALEEFVQNPITVAVEPTGESTMDRDSLIKGFLGFSAELSALTISLQDVSLNVDAKKTRATAKGETLLTLVDVQGVRRTEPRRFTVTLAREHGDWLVEQARISASRIDQPEARP